MRFIDGTYQVVVFGGYYYKTFKYVIAISVLVQLGMLCTIRSDRCIFDAAGDTGGGLVIFIIATSAIVIPMIVYQIMNKMGKVGHIVTLHGDEKTFEETFPPINQVKDAE